MAAQASGAPCPRRRSRTLDEALAGRPNSLNALRIVFAGSVIVSHAWWLGGYGPEPALYGIKLGTAAVAGFFAISGYLITVSAERSSPRRYAAARFARIYPALAVAVLLVAFAAAPAGALLTHGSYDLCGAVAFASAALALGIGLMRTPPIGTSLAGNHDALDWDGPLWTLTWEAACYVVVALAVYALRRRGAGAGGHRAAVLLLFAAATGGVAGKVLGGGYGSDRAEFVLPLLAVFMAGSLLATQRHRVPVGAAPAVAAAAMVWAALATGCGTVLAPLPFAYLVLCAGSAPIGAPIGRRLDVSYGLYVYGWPVQQLLAAARVPAHLPVLGFAVASLLAAWPLGLISCLAVERPARALLRRPRDRALHTSVPEESPGSP